MSYGVLLAPLRYVTNIRTINSEPSTSRCVCSLRWMRCAISASCSWCGLVILPLQRYCLVNEGTRAQYTLLLCNGELDCNCCPLLSQFFMQIVKRSRCCVMNAPEAVIVDTCLLSNDRPQHTLSSSSSSQQYSVMEPGR